MHIYTLDKDKHSCDGDHICAPDVRMDWFIKRDNIVKQELNISSAFLSTGLFCLDCTVASTTCLFKRFGSQIPVKANVILQNRKSTRSSLLLVGSEKEREG